MISRRILPTVLASLFVLAGLSFGPCAATAQNDTRGGPTPPRLGFIDGQVSFWRPGADEWSQAQINTALAAGDSLYAADGGNMEIQVGPRAFVRAGADTEIDLTSLDPDYMQFRITGGHAALDLKKLPGGQRIEVDTPNAAFTIERPGYYRVDVDENRTAFSAGRGGTAMVVPATGEATDVAENQQIILAGTDTVQVNVNAAPAPDEWDRWNFDRTAQLSETPRSAQYVPPDIAGVDDLDRYGDWREQPRYGHVWVPRDVSPDWAPYSTGRWVYDPAYEWTWVDESPWGWAPYHYGRWVNFDGVWGWAPGPVVVAPVYSPALVAFFGAPGIGVSVSVGLPFVSWCALGFGEPIVPWWGGRGFVGRPYWGGWGGPRVVNNVVINNTRIVNVTNINTYQNVNVRNAVMAGDRNQFGRGRMDHVRLDAQHVQQLQPVRGDLRVRPVAASFVAREAHGQRPPDQLQARRVVATRPTQDPMSRLRAKGVAGAAAVTRPEPRVVRAQRGPSGPGARPQAGVGAAGPGAAGRQQPPAAPAGQPPGGVGAARPERPGRPARAERAQPGAPGTSGRAVPPPPPRGERALQGQPSRSQPAPPSAVGRPAPPVPATRERAGRAPAREVPPSRVEPPARPPAARQERMAPPPPARPQAAPQERAAPQQPARPPAVRQERAAPPQAARPQAAPQQRAAPPQAARPPAVRQERAAPPQAARPQAAPQQRVAPPQAARPQAAPQQRVAPPQAARPQAAPQQRAAPPQAARGRPAAAEKKGPHDATQQQR